MKTYQIWFLNEDVLLLQAEATDVVNNVARFLVAGEIVGAFSFEQILGFCNTDYIVETEEDESTD